MKWLINARTVEAAGFVMAAVALYVPTTAQAQTTVSANWVQTATQGPSPRGGPAMAYDSLHRRTVLFGGSSGYLADTWLYDGTAWSQMQVAGPSGRYLASMVYDSARGVTVLFGGYNFNGIQSDTWEWNGATWTQRLPQHTPPARLWTAMTYDIARHETVLFGGSNGTLLNDTWVYDGTDWTQAATAQAPPVRRAHAMAYDAARARTVMFGGQDPTGTNLNDTWEFDGTAWSQVTAANAPSARLWHSMAYDANLGGAVVFGGTSYTAEPFPGLNDTWLFDGSDWQQISPNININPRLQAALSYDSDRGELVLFGGAPNIQYPQQYGDTWALRGTTTSPVDWAQAAVTAAPPARVFAQMDYDSARGVSVLFGGSTDAGPGNLQDTWEWNGSSWALRPPAASPPSLAAGMMAYDSGRGVSVLFGGDGSAGLSSATWEYDGTTWAQRNPAAAPPGRVWAGMAYDSARSRTVLFGGNGSGVRLGDTWEYDGTTWTQMHPGSSPSPRLGPALAYDPILGKTVLFGGSTDSGRVADTWEWDGTNWTQIPTSMAPSPRFWSSLAFDSQRGTTVLFGGDHVLPYDLGESNDTWEWDGRQWTLVPTAAAPPIRSGEGTSYDTARGRMVVFGGWNAATSPPTIYGDTWELGSGIATAPGTPVASLLQNGTLNFGNVFIGQSSQASQTYAAFRLTNTGTGPLTVNSITVAGGDFPVTNYCPVGGSPLAAGSTCMTLIVFTPVAAGARTGSVTFNYDAPGGNQTFQLQGNGVLNPTTLTVFPASGLFNGTTTVVASLATNGSALAGQPVTLTLPSGASTTIQTDALGRVVWAGASLAGVHAGSDPTGIHASFPGSSSYAASAASTQLTVVQPVMTTYNGQFYVTDSTAPDLTIGVDQRTPASDPQFIDYAKNVVWARITVIGPASSTVLFAQVTDAASWSSTGLGVATTSLPALADGAYTVVAELVDGPSFVPPSSAVASDDARAGFVSSPSKGAYVSGGGAIASDPSANTSDTHGYFSLQLKPGKAPAGNVVYVYRVRMDVGGGNVRDVDVWVTSTGITTLNGRMATGQFSVQYVDAQTGQRYSALEFSGGTFTLTFANATGSSPAKFGLVLMRPDGTVFHSTGADPAPVVLGRLVSAL